MADHFDSNPKYHLWYDAIINRARGRGLSGYVERHHVIPRCLGGSNDESNLVTLTYREHFLAHWLLTKFTEGLARRKMQNALGRMSHSNSTRKIVAGWQYEIGKRAFQDAMKGAKLSLERCAKISEGQKGKKRNKFSPEHRANISAARKGIKLSVEHRAKISAALKGSPEFYARKGIKFSPEHRAKISAAMKGIKFSPEHIANMSKVKKGRKLSLEHCAKIGMALKGKTKSPEHCAKIRAALTGIKLSPEHRAKVGAALRGKKISLETRAARAARAALATSNQEVGS